MTFITQFSVRVGVIGYSSPGFDVGAATAWLTEHITSMHKQFGNRMCLVSGMTNLGVPGIAYTVAKQLGIHTVGIACKEAAANPCFPVSESIIYGDDWGDESAVFLSSITHMLRVGGGEQSQAEALQFMVVRPDRYAYLEL